jgi:hypothetical protein
VEKKRIFKGPKFYDIRQFMYSQEFKDIEEKSIADINKMNTRYLSSVPYEFINHSKSSSLEKIKVIELRDVGEVIKGFLYVIVYLCLQQFT